MNEWEKYFKPIRKSDKNKFVKSEDLYNVVMELDSTLPSRDFNELLTYSLASQQIIQIFCIRKSLPFTIGMVLELVETKMKNHAEVWKPVFEALQHYDLNFFLPKRN